MEYSFWATTNIIMAITLLIQQLSFIGSIRVGVNYGLNGDNLPSPADTISLFGKCHIDFIRIFDPNHEVLEALRGKPILLSLGVKNEDLQSLASDPSAADQWIKDNVSPYISDVNIGFITLGNEVIPGPQSQYVAGAIKNTLTALNNAQIIKDIKVTTVVGSNALASSYPPSAGAFIDEAASAFRDIAPILSQSGSPIMLNVYPYFAYASDPEHISSDYALFTANQTIVSDGDYNYQNLFDAMVDSFVAAFEKVGAPEISIVVSESGWPSAGNEPFTTIEMAKTYNRNLADHVQGVIGTPRRRNQRFDVLLFEMFNENLKPAGTEQNFGFFNPNMQPVYQFWPC